MLAEFRVSKVDLRRLAEALRVSRRFRSAQGTVCSGGRVCYSKSKRRQISAENETRDREQTA